MAFATWNAFSSTLLVALVTSVAVEGAQSCYKRDRAGNCLTMMPTDEGVPAIGSSLFQPSLSSAVMPVYHAPMNDDMQDDYDVLNPRLEFKKTGKSASKSSSRIDKCPDDAKVAESLEICGSDGRGLAFDVLLGVVCMYGVLLLYDLTRPKTPAICKESPQAWCTVGSRIYGVISQDACADGEDSDDEAFLAGLRAEAAARLQAGAGAKKTVHVEEDAWGCSSLHRAVAQGAADEVETLLQGCADIDSRDFWGETPLHFAARQGCAAVCSLLLEKDADVDATNDSGETVLVVAAKAANEAVCELLLAQGAGVGGIADNELPPMLNELFMKRLLSQHED
jgi:hypothetical protein